ncbi:MAG: hypothetical protein M3Q64_01475, partial [bacterium]|nr:hypothetical protein [bacterium]
MSEINNNNIEEMLRQAQELEKQLEIEKVQNKEKEVTAKSAGTVEKIQADRTEQGVQHEGIKELQQKQNEARQRIPSLEEGLQKLDENRTLAKQKLESPDTAAAVKGMYQTILEEIDSDQGRIENEIKEAHDLLTGTVGREESEFISRTNREAAEVLGYDQKTQDIKRYFEQQREFQQEPEKYADKIDLLAEEIVSKNVRNLNDYVNQIRRSNDKMSRSQINIGNSTSISERDSGRTDKQVRKIVNDRWEKSHQNISDNEKWQIEKTVIDEEAKFVHDLAANPLLIKALEEKRLQKTEEALQKNFSYLRSDELEIVRDALQYHALKISLPEEGKNNYKSVTQWLHSEPVVGKPEFMVELPEDEQKLIEKAVKNSPITFQSLAQDLNLAYNEKSLEQIQNEALEENEAMDREKRTAQIEAQLKRKIERLEEIENNRRISELSTTYQNLRNQVRQVGHLEQSKETTQSRLDAQQEELKKVESVTNFLGMVKDRQSQKDHSRRIEELSKEIADYNQKIQESLMSYKSTDELNAEFKTIEEHMVKEIEEYNPRT